MILIGSSPTYLRPKGVSHAVPDRLRPRFRDSGSFAAQLLRPQRQRGASSSPKRSGTAQEEIRQRHCHQGAVV